MNQHWHLVVIPITQHRPDQPRLSSISYQEVCRQFIFLCKNEHCFSHLCSCPTPATKNWPELENFRLLIKPGWKGKYKERWILCTEQSWWGPIHFSWYRDLFDTSRLPAVHWTGAPTHDTSGHTSTHSPVSCGNLHRRNTITQYIHIHLQHQQKTTAKP